ncbi:MAG TPA: YtxH domain-containing protein [Anaerolineales bacterium]|jgi:gas vesicle protein|nr:YtxH domain-containing protein [Anaerolineales bacterium]
MQRLGSFLLGAVLGGLIGASVAILLAPSSGEELRTGMKERVYEIRSEVADAAAQRRAELESRLAALRAPASPESQIPE